MADLKKMQEEAIASVDAAKALVEKVMSMIKIITDSPSLSASFSTNPIKFLTWLLSKLGVTREEMEFWLTNFIIKVVPILEVSVKAILLTNLKNMISCSVDPRIPEKYRKRHKAPTDYNTSQEYGIDINIESIDYLDKLSVNPLGEFGSQWYFGLEGVDDAYKFARADDFDAFLWFVIHKGKFPNSSAISQISDIGDIGGGNGIVMPSDGSLLSAIEVMYDEKSSSSILLGNTFKYDGVGHIISMCIDRKLGDENNIIHNTLVPVSDDWSSVNWYARRADQLGKNLGFGWEVEALRNENGEITGTSNSVYKGKGRDYTKERALCNIQYINQSSSDAPITGLVNNKFRFTILPKPLIHIPQMSKGEPPWRFKKMLFNDKGEYDPNGKYTIVNPNEPIYDSNELSYLDGAVTIDPKSGKVTVNDKEKVIRSSVECYPGLTVYEFNYDYVMSIKLFDAKILAHSLIESVLNLNMELNANIGMRHQEGTEMIKEIIKNILESDDSELNDCYYTFDNTKYELLLRKAEEKRARQQRFGNVTHEVGMYDSIAEILNEYNANAALHEQIDVLHRAITQASVIVTEGVDDKDKLEIQFNFIFDVVENLVTVLVNSILSPKLLMLLEVNQKIMGGTWEKFSLKDILMALHSVITAIVKEIRDLILQELLKLATDILKPIKLSLIAILTKEQLDSYAEAILNIMRYYSPLFFRFGNQYQNTTLDAVDYADIDLNETNEGDRPSTNEC